MWRSSPLHCSCIGAAVGFPCWEHVFRNGYGYFQLSMCKHAAQWLIVSNFPSLSVVGADDNPVGARSIILVYVLSSHVIVRKHTVLRLCPPTRLFAMQRHRRFRGRNHHQIILNCYCSAVWRLTLRLCLAGTLCAAVALGKGNTAAI